MTEYAGQKVRPGPRLDEVPYYLARIATSLERIAGHLEHAGQPHEAGPVAANRLKPTPRVSERRAKARDFVEDLLRYQGPQPWKEIVRRGRYYGHSATTMERVRRNVAVSKKVDGHWVWQLRSELGDGGDNG